MAELHGSTKRGWPLLDWALLIAALIMLTPFFRVAIASWYPILRELLWQTSSMR